MMGKEKAVSELHKKMNWYLACVKLNQLAGKGAYVAAVMASAPYITRFYETGHLGAFVVPGLAFCLAKMAKWAVDDANESLNDKRKDIRGKINVLLKNQNTR